VIRVEASVEINRPVEEVFSYTSNPENFPQWAATVREVRQDAPGGDPLREGERFTATQQALGRRFEAPFEVIDYEPNRRYAHRSREGHPVPVTMDFTYEPRRRMGRASRRASRRSLAASSDLWGWCLRG